MAAVWKALVVLAVPMILISWAVMIGMNFIAISQAVLPAFRHFEDPQIVASRRNDWLNVVPGERLEHLVWFLQITDLHVSEYVDKSRIAQLEQFCTETVDAIKPAVVIVSGDLTDAKTLGNFGSEQREWEWKEYARVVKETKVTERTVWLDIRGNHDTFNVPSLDSKQNYYKKHSQRGNGTSYHYVHSYGLDKLSFIAVDACPNPGFRRPFNFFGVITEEHMRHLETLGLQSLQSNVTVWFGHYPTSVISSPSPGITNVMGSGVAYLSGHLHTLGGVLPELYAMQKSGTLELELGDWKDNRLFRLLAMDHDLFSFVDVHFNEWPIGLITNPKNVKFYAPVHEPLDRISRSTHVRVVAFSPSGIKSVEILLPDSSDLKFASQVGNTSLFVLPWDVSRYAVGTHAIQAIITDNTGRVGEIVQDFATRDAEVPTFGIVRRLVLMADIGKIFTTLTYGIAIANLSVLLLFGSRATSRLLSFVISNCGLHGLPIGIIRDLKTAVSIPWVFWSLLINTSYVLIMPWFYGEIVDETYGVVFAFGIRFDKEWLHGQMTYMYAVTHLVMHCLPLTICTALYVRSRLKHPALKISRIFYHAVYGFIVLSQVLSLRIFAQSYGSLAVITNGLLIWSGVVPTLFLWWKSWNMLVGPSS